MKNKDMLRLCSFCNKEYQTDIYDLLNIELKNYKYGNILGSIVQNMTMNVSYNLTGEINMVNKTLEVFIPRCKKCEKKHTSISLFDFETKKIAKKVLKKNLLLYINDGYKIEFMDITTKNSFAQYYVEAEKNRWGYIPIPIISYNQFLVYKTCISFIVAYLKMNSYLNHISNELFIDFLINDFNIPEHELNIFLKFYSQELLEKQNFEFLINNLVKNTDKKYLILILKLLFKLLIQNNKDIKNKIVELLIYEELFNVECNDLNNFRYLKDN